MDGGWKGWAEVEIKKKKRREADGNWDAIVLLCLVYRKLRRSVGLLDLFLFRRGARHEKMVLFFSFVKGQGQGQAWIALGSACALSCFVSFVMGRSLVGHGADCV